MKLMETLNQCINAGHEMTKAITHSLMMTAGSEKITRRWRIGEGSGFSWGFFSGYQRCRESRATTTRIWKFEDGLSNVLVIQLNKLIICVMCWYAIATC